MLIQELVISGVQESQIDEAAGVIRDVKLLGKVSKNKRVYTEAALDESARFYNGIRVNLDHPPIHNAKSERKFTEGVGVIRNVRRAENEVRGDFHYLKTHPYGPSIAESARRFPESFGFSHNAEGETKMVNGQTYVEHITKAHSLDVVTRPATTEGLFEEEDPSLGGQNMSESTISEAIKTLPPEYQGIPLLFPKHGEKTISLSETLLQPGQEEEKAKKIVQEMLKYEIETINMKETSQVLLEASQMTNTKTGQKTAQQILEDLDENYDLENLTDEDLEKMSDEELEVLQALIQQQEEEEGIEDQSQETSGEEEEELAGALESVLQDINSRIATIEKREYLQDLLEADGLVIDHETRAVILEAETPEKMQEMVRNIPRTASHFRSGRPRVETVLETLDEFPSNGKEFAKALKSRR
jgi:hypothetical protein